MKLLFMAALVKKGNNAEEKAVYMVGDKVDVRTAMGRAMKDVITENLDTPIAELDCDLEGFLKLTEES